MGKKNGRCNVNLLLPTFTGDYTNVPGVSKNVLARVETVRLSFAVLTRRLKISTECRGNITRPLRSVTEQMTFSPIQPFLQSPG